MGHYNGSGTGRGMRPGEPPPMNEQDLIQNSRDGDLESFNQLVEIYQRPVYNLALRMLGSVAPAEDATQEAFLSAFRNIGKYRGGSFRGWLFRIATNACYDQMRASKRHGGPSLEALLEDSAWEPRSTETSPEDQAMNTELATELSAAIDALSADHRAVLVLADVEGFSYEEVAQATGCSVGTVKSRLSRARGRVRDHFAERRELLPASLRLEK